MSVNIPNSCLNRTGLIETFLSKKVNKTDSEILTHIFNQFCPAQTDGLTQEEEYFLHALSVSSASSVPEVQEKLVKIQNLFQRQLTPLQMALILSDDQNMVSRDIPYSMYLQRKVQIGFSRKEKQILLDGVQPFVGPGLSNIPSETIPNEDYDTKIKNYEENQAFIEISTREVKETDREFMWSKGFTFCSALILEITTSEDKKSFALMHVMMDFEFEQKEFLQALSKRSHVKKIQAIRVTGSVSTFYSDTKKVCYIDVPFKDLRCVTGAHYWMLGFDPEKNKIYVTETLGQRTFVFNGFES
jgi:hypothetical protein